MNKKIAAITALLLALIFMTAGAFLLLKKDTERSESKTDHTTEQEFTVSHGTGETLADFDAGNELLVDMWVISVLEEMEANSDEAEDEINALLDTLIMLVNHFSREDYTPDENRAAQRYWFENRENFSGMGFEEMCEVISLEVLRGGDR